MDQSALLSLGRFWRNCFDWYTNSVPDKGLAVSKSSDHEHHEQSGESGGNLWELVLRCRQRLAKMAKSYHRRRRLFTSSWELILMSLGTEQHQRCRELAGLAGKLGNQGCAESKADATSSRSVFRFLRKCTHAPKRGSCRCDRAVIV